MNERRIIYADDLKKALADYHVLDEAPMHVAATVDQYIDCAPVIDPETLSLVKELREKLTRYELAEESGHLVELPCKKGDKLFVLTSDSPSGIEETRCKKITVGTNVNRPYITITAPCIYDDWGGCVRIFHKSDFGNIVFLTRKEAENALKENKNHG